MKDKILPNELKKPRKRRQTALRYYRTLAGLNQQQLSDISGIPLKSIQSYEQGKRDINKAAAGKLYELSKILNCKMEELLETQDAEE